MWPTQTTHMGKVNVPDLATHQDQDWDPLLAYPWDPGKVIVPDLEGSRMGHPVDLSVEIALAISSVVLHGSIQGYFVGLPWVCGMFSTHGLLLGSPGTCLYHSLLSNFSFPFILLWEKESLALSLEPKMVPHPFTMVSYHLML